MLQIYYFLQTSTILLTTFVVFFDWALIVKSEIIGPIEDALYLHNKSGTNYTRDDCFWLNERKTCSENYTKLYIISKQGPLVVRTDQSDWLRNSDWKSDLESVILVHGYASTHTSLPMEILTDAYRKNENFNIFVYDWSPLAIVPCYPAAVHNLKYAAKCLSQYLTFLRNSGIQNSQMTCIGHSLGAHLCGQVSNTLKFKLKKIIGLDPARPLIRDQKALRLDSEDAFAVHVFHTNGGHYGTLQKTGTVDFCLNGGRVQPYCQNSTDINMCSHLGSVCYLAESVALNKSYLAEPCSRRCGFVSTSKFSKPALMGYQMDNEVSGTYCFNSDQQPHCNVDQRCCVKNAN